MRNRRTVLLVLLEPEYEQNYLMSGVCDELIEQFEELLIIRKDLTHQTLHLYKFPNLDLPLHSFDVPRSPHFLIKLIFELRRRRFRDLSKSFIFREARLYKSIYWKLKESRWRSKSHSLRLERESISNRTFSPSLRISNFLLKHFKEQFRFLLIKCLATNPLYQVMMSYYQSGFFGRKLHAKYLSLFSHLSQVGLEAMIIPSSGNNAIESELLRVSRICKMASILIVDNWDNLSSKTVLLESPDMCLVWSEQMKEHAMRIHSIPESRIKIAGSARIYGYTKFVKNLCLPKFADYILFLGSFSEFDEERCLQVLQTVVERISLESSEKPLRIVYRPHPQKLSLQTIDLSRYQSIVFHKDFLSKEFPISSVKYSPLLELPFLILNSRLVLGGLTTAMLESILLGKPYIGLVHKENSNFSSPHKTLSNYEHFSGVEKIEGLSLCHDLDTLKDILITCLSPKSATRENAHLSYFYDFNSASPASTLIKVIDDLTNRSK